MSLVQQPVACSTKSREIIQRFPFNCNEHNLCVIPYILVDKISKVAPDSDEDLQPQVELVNKKNQNREGTISKPRAKRGSLPEMTPHNRTPSLDKDKIQKGIQVGRKLSQSPSVVNIQGHPINSDDGGEDD